MRSRGFSRQMKRFGLFAMILAGLLVSLPARADLVVFQEGQVVKAASYRVVDNELEIGLPGGGSYRVDLERVERIVEDEVLVADVCVQTDPALTGGAYDLSYRED